MSTFEKIELIDIDASNNIRRASPHLTNKGIDLIHECVVGGLNNSMIGWNKFLNIVAEDTKLISLARSLAITGQIHPITVIKAGKKYRCISGQRRFVAMVILECLRNVLRYGENEDIEAAKKIFEKNFEELPSIDYDAIGEQKSELTLMAEVRGEMSEEEVVRIAFTANEEALPLSDIDWANWLNKMKEKINPATGKEYKWRELADITGKSESWLRLRIHLMLLPDEWKNKLDSKEINITKASAYALVIYESTLESDIVAEKPTAKITEIEDEVESIDFDEHEPVISKMREVEDDSEDEPEVARVADIKDMEDDVDNVVTDTDASTPPVRDWTEGKRKGRSKSKPKLLSYDEVLNMLRMLDKTDVHGITLLAKVLQIDYETAEGFAGSTADAIGE
jgi:ParB-like chromosome segregation protein Spo0J